MKGDKVRSLLSVSYVAIMFFALHYFSLYYVLSNYLNKYFNESTLSAVFAIGSFLCIVVANYLGRFLKKYSNSKTLAVSLIIQFFITILLAFSDKLSLPILILAFLIQYVLFTLIFVCISIFIEMFSKDENTGTIRGTVLTIQNFGAILAPFVTSQIFNLVGYAGLFIISAIAVLPLLYLVKKYYSQVKEPNYGSTGIFTSLNVIGWNKNIRGVLASSFILNSFYVIANVYLALYLVNVLKIPLFIYLEIVVPISIIPFILVPYKLGKYSDEIFGEKIPIIIGIIIMSIILISIYVFNITTTNVLVWIILIFVARIGATVNETSNYTYFYKSVDSKNVGLISLFQNISNISFVIITGLGAVLISIFKIDIKLLFLIVGVLGLLSLFIIVKMQDKETILEKELAEKEKNSNLKKEGQKDKEQILDFPKKKEVKIWA